MKEFTFKTKKAKKYAKEKPEKKLCSHLVKICIVLYVGVVGGNHPLDFCNPALEHCWRLGIIIIIFISQSFFFIFLLCFVNALGTYFFFCFISTFFFLNLRYKIFLLKFITQQLAEFGYLKMTHEQVMMLFLYERDCVMRLLGIHL